MKKLTTEEFISRSRLKHDNRYIYLNTKYLGLSTKIIITCLIHGNFLQTPHNHLMGKGCRLCKNIKLSKDRAFSISTFIKKSTVKHKNLYDYSKVKYVNAQTPVEIICKNHGSFLQSPMNHFKGVGCPKCGLNKLSAIFSSNKEDFINKSRAVFGSIYNYSKVIYKNALTKVKIVCEKHGDFLKTPNKHLRGQGCPHCTESKGEKKIREFLEKKDIKFIPQKTFKECKNVKPLPFDFYLPELNTIIEYDGKQHFYPINFSGKLKNERIFYNYEQSKFRDDIKTKFCIKNEIRLLRISYICYEKIEEFLKFNLI